MKRASSLLSPNPSLTAAPQEGYAAYTRGLLAVSLLGLAACGDAFVFPSESSTSSGAAGGAGTTGSGTATGAGGAPPAACAEATGDVSLAGTWAMRAELAVKLGTIAGGAIQVCPPDQVAKATLLMMVTIEEDAADPKKLPAVRATLCSLELPEVTSAIGFCDPASSNLVHARFLTPPMLADALPAAGRALAAGALTGLEPGAGFTAGPLALALGSTKHGVEMPAWKTESLPCGQPGLGHTSVCEAECVTDCSALRDDDADAYPGITVEVCGATADEEKANVPCNASMPSTPGVTLQGKAFMDLSISPKLTGTVKSACEVTGTVGAEWLYNVVGADVYLAGAPLPVSMTNRSLPSFEVDEKASSIRMVRVDGRFGAPSWDIDPASGAAACGAIRAHAPEL